MANNPRQLDLVGFTLIIDDIVLPDGQTCMQQIGGGGPQTLFGFQLVSRCLQRSTSVGLAAGVGADLPQQCLDWLVGIGCSTAGLAVGQLPTPRAWQLFEEDGRRTQVWRVPECDELYQQLRPRFDELPLQFQEAARSFHLGIHASHPPMKLLRALRAAAHQQGGVLSVEPYTACDSPPSAEQLSALLQLTDVFSPNEAEAASIIGPGSPEELVARLLAAGAAVVALRQGPQGALVGEQATGQMWQVPAVPGTRVTDVTGCGNAFCGGFLAARLAGLDLHAATRWGCVAGSVMAEHQGVPPADVQRLVQTAVAKHGKVLDAEANQSLAAVVATAGGGSTVARCLQSSEASGGGWRQQRLPVARCWRPMTAMTTVRSGGGIRRHVCAAQRMF